MKKRAPARLMAAALITLSLLVASPHWAHAMGSVRCGTRIINYGTPKEEVLKNCGTPDSEDYNAWIYNRGSTRFYTVIRFTGGKVSSVENGKHF